MILETLVTTHNTDGTLNIAPQGPLVLEPEKKFLFRPFQESQTFANLAREKCGVMHIHDDPLLLAQAALHVPEPWPALRPAAKIKGQILAGACRYYEFVISEIDARQQRSEMTADVVASGRLRDFVGWNRAQGAIIEATIIATRIARLCAAEINAELRRLRIIVEKTGGDRELIAWVYVEQYVRERLPSGS